MLLISYIETNCNCKLVKKEGKTYMNHQIEKKKPLGIYVHIPFCIKKCAYCDFLSMPAEEEVKKQYVSAVLEEIEDYRQWIKEYQVKTIYFGGGTPSLLAEKYINNILHKLQEVFEIDDLTALEITLEVNPGTADATKWKAYKEMGINRISMGLQSVDNKTLKKIGRIHTYENFLENFHMARKCGFENISVDIMSALPEQTIEQYEQTLETVAQLSPEHISSYSLIIEEGTLFWKWYKEGGELEHELPDEELERKMYELTKEILKKYGYERYEISNYARKGYESKHNSSYWIGVSYLGIGLGASSFFEGQRYQNVTVLKDYLENAGNKEQRIQNREKIGITEAIQEFMFLGLRRMCGVSKEEFKKRFGQSMEVVYGEILKDLSQKGLLCIEGDNVYLTDYGIDVSNYVFSAFL